MRQRWPFLHASAKGRFVATVSARALNVEMPDWMSLGHQGMRPEFERELIRARTGDGRKRAKARGVRFGRPPKLTPHQGQEALARLQTGETQTDVARSYNVDPTTIGRLQSLTASA